MRKPRRVVTGHNKQGKSVVLFAEPALLVGILIDAEAL
jgi:hypothetical protein